jgi:NAD+ kinase
VSEPVASAAGARSATVAFVATDTEPAQRGLAELTQRYKASPPEEADIIVALGGDGFMLETLHRYLDRHVPIYGMHRGTVGFLMNEFRPDRLIERLGRAQPVTLHPLAMTAHDKAGKTHKALAINEVSLLREARQAAKIRVSVDGIVRLDELMGDGVLVSTPVGSTAYNLSAHGPILPIYAPLLALTPISAFRPRTWRGALLPDHVTVHISVLEADKRPVNAVADNVEFKSIVDVTVSQDKQADSLILFDPDHSWDERILTEQFRY